MRRRLLVFAAALVVGLLLVEAAVRTRQFVRFGTAGKTFHELVDDPESGLRIPAPNTVSGPIHINADGFRGPAVPLERPAHTVRVAFLGGSTTFCAEASSEDLTWPALVLAGLREAFPGVAFDGINAGTAGFTAHESLVNLEHRVARFHPDVLVVYHGTNDFVHAARELAVAAGRYDPNASESDWLSDHWLTFYLLKKNVLFRHRLAHAQETTSAFELPPGAIASAFESTLLPLLDAARATASLVCLPSFAVKVRADQTPERRAESCASALYYMPFLDPAGVLQGYAEINETLRKVAAERPDVLFVGGEDEIPGDDEHFSDTVHFLDPGSRAQAHRVLQALIADPRLRALCEERTSRP